MIHTFSISSSPAAHLKTNLHTYTPTITNNTKTNFLVDKGTRKITKWVIQSSDNPTVVITSPPDDAAIIESASSVVRKFYQGINSRDLVSVETLIAENCVYEDLIFPRPFVGRQVSIYFSSFEHSLALALALGIEWLCFT
ncbi:Uncharacterized protein Adt_23029 [Abeliophyllum distichum]|uniref:Uncharacterized protein n=1 Tax=Abeliophyllum distichum TaxID=126358 RepID=A0ABD1S9Q4_9LAMI